MGVHDEVTAIGPMETTALNVGEMGGNDAGFHFVFETAEQVVVGWMSFQDDWCSIRLAIVDEEIYFIPAQIDLFAAI